MDPYSANKRQRLKEDGALHPHPQKVSTGLLAQSAFFDAHDLMQMKYEMLRGVNVDQNSVAEAARSFGLSRVAFYRAQRHFRKEGLTGLSPQKRGPKRPHKLTDTVMAFVHEQSETLGKTPDWALIRERVKQKFGTQVHARSIERAVNREKRGV
jgi:transposase